MFGKGGAELIAAKVKLEFLEKENSDLKLQVQRLQDALIAKTSPVAYSNMISDRETPATNNIIANNQNDLQEDANLLKKYLDELASRPIFENPAEFINYVKGKENLESSLEEVITAPPVTESLYNEES